MSAAFLPRLPSPFCARDKVPLIARFLEVDVPGKRQIEDRPAIAKDRNAKQDETV
jgi:hypothetical protein